MKRRQMAGLAAGAAMAWSGMALGGSGPLGIDSQLNYDNQGIWKRSNQKALLGLMLGGEAAGALWEGGESRLGKTFWQSIDATVFGAAGYLVLNNTLTRRRPSETSNPNDWFHGGHSFPSGEVTATSAIVTPFVLEYGHDHPAMYALELLPLYDAEARMKVRGHWQTDVLAGYALGTAAGFYAHSRQMPFTLGVLPHGFMVGFNKRF